MREWEKFKVGKPSTQKNWTEPSCQPLGSIYHVTHIQTAARILFDGRIISGLVYDRSRLNKERIQVVWLSPNDWLGAGGSRYGNIRLSFDFKSLIRGGNYYWVESVPYSPEAVRFLVSDNDYSHLLTPYKPEVDKGPWWFDRQNGIHYWNGNYCLEIMLEGDVNLEWASHIDSVKHHPKRCNILKDNCPDCGLGSELAIGSFLATVVGLQLDPTQLKWVVGGYPEFELQHGWVWLKSGLLKRMKVCKFASSKPSLKRSTIAIGRAILAAYSRRDPYELKALAEIMSSEKAAVEACAKAIAKDFGIINWKTLEDL